MKIAVFHNLGQGGALNYIINVSNSLAKNNVIELYSFANVTNSEKQLYNKIFNIQLNKTNNIFSHTIQSISELHKKSIIIANKINSVNYDLIIVCQCYITQSPYILRYLTNTSRVIYILHEPKREFYEVTSFDYYSPKKIVSRLIRRPIKYIDQINCKSANNIICNSKYSQNLIKKIYKKNSKIIYPGLIKQKKSCVIKQNNNIYVSIGQLSSLKGYDELIKLFNKLKSKLIIIGRDYPERRYLESLVKHNNIEIKINISDTEKNSILKHSTFYIANQRNEPFGMATLEAAEAGCYVIGNNSGGTPEIIKNNINGLIWPNGFKTKLEILKYLSKQKTVKFTKISSINWNITAEQILSYYKSINDH